MAMLVACSTVRQPRRRRGASQLLGALLGLSALLLGPSARGEALPKRVAVLVGYRFHVSVPSKSLPAAPFDLARMIRLMALLGLRGEEINVFTDASYNDLVCAIKRLDDDDRKNAKSNFDTLQAMAPEPQAGQAAETPQKKAARRCLAEDRPGAQDPVFQYNQRKPEDGVGPGKVPALTDVLDVLVTKTESLRPSYDRFSDDPRSLVFFYFTGHGESTVEPLTTPPQLQSSLDEQLDRDNPPVDAAFHRQLIDPSQRRTSLDLAAIVARLDHLGRPTRKVVVIDACTTARAQNKQTGKWSNIREAIELHGIHNANLLFSSSFDQTSHWYEEPDKRDESVFTKHFYDRALRQIYDDSEIHFNQAQFNRLRDDVQQAVENQQQATPQKVFTSHEQTPDKQQPASIMDADGDGLRLAIPDRKPKGSL